MKTRTKIKRFFEDHLPLQKISIKKQKEKADLFQRNTSILQGRNLFLKLKMNSL
jgi:hypothetical protein